MQLCKINFDKKITIYFLGLSTFTHLNLECKKKRGKPQKMNQLCFY